MSKPTKYTMEAIEFFTAKMGTPAILTDWTWDNVVRPTYCTNLRTAAKYMGYTEHKEWIACPEDWDEEEDGEWYGSRWDVWYTKD